jgi:diacylglycerol kinase family enzyme
MYENLNTIFLMGQNGKFGGGGMMLNPLAIMNDGLMDIIVSE